MSDTAEKSDMSDDMLNSGHGDDGKKKIIPDEYVEVITELSTPNSPDPDAAMVTSLLRLIRSGAVPGYSFNERASSEERLNDVDSEKDRKYKPPSFSLPSFDEKEKLRGYHNYRNWKSKLELALKANICCCRLSSPRTVSRMLIFRQTNVNF